MRLEFDGHNLHVIAEREADVTELDRLFGPAGSDFRLERWPAVAVERMGPRFVIVRPARCHVSRPVKMKKRGGK